jgi:putative glutamine amidotransferase
VEGRLPHRQAVDRTNAHDIALRPGSQVAAAMQLEHLNANSRHHQGIDKVGHGLVPTAFAPDGLVEAVEDPSLPFWVAVQWHPENLAGTPHEKLFRALVEAARLIGSVEIPALLDGTAIRHFTVLAVIMREAETQVRQIQGGS